MQDYVLLKKENTSKHMHVVKLGLGLGLLCQSQFLSHIQVICIYLGNLII